MEYQHLLLIFRKWGETYWLINRPGLPVSPDSPLLLNTPSDPILVPDLLASLTETLSSDTTVYTGYQFLNTWTTTITEPEPEPEPTDHFILLERHHHSPTNKSQTQNQVETQAEAQTHTHRTMPGSLNWMSRDMSRINGHLSQALEICGSDLCALLAQE